MNDEKSDILLQSISASDRQNILHNMADELNSANVFSVVDMTNKNAEIYAYTYDFSTKSLHKMSCMGDGCAGEEFFKYIVIYHKTSSEYSVAFNSELRCDTDKRGVHTVIIGCELLVRVDSIFQAMDIVEHDSLTKLFSQCAYKYINCADFD